MTSLETEEPSPVDARALPSEREVKDLFRSNTYADIFNPEDEGNPFREIYAEKLSYVVSLLQERSGTLVDLGGGPGRYSSALAEARADRKVLHFDLSAEMVRRARTRARTRNVRHGVADAEHPPLRAGSVDTLLALDLYCHLPHPTSFLEAARLLLAENGRLVLDNSNARAWWMFAYTDYLHPRWHARRFFDAFFRGGVPKAWAGRVHHYRRSTFEKHLRQAGFFIESRRDFGPKYCPKWHLIVARKTERNAG